MKTGIPTSRILPRTPTCKQHCRKQVRYLQSYMMVQFRMRYSHLCRLLLLQTPHPPCTSQESAWIDYDACQDQETSKVDIGEIFYKAKTPKEFSYTRKTLTMSQKYHLLTIPKEQLKEKAFPAQYLACCNGSFCV